MERQGLLQPFGQTAGRMFIPAHFLGYLSLTSS
jgi:hypothetical protein